MGRGRLQARATRTRVDSERLSPWGQPAPGQSKREGDSLESTLPQVRFRSTDYY